MEFRDGGGGPGQQTQSPTDRPTLPGTNPVIPPPQETNNLVQLGSPFDPVNRITGEPESLFNSSRFAEEDDGGHAALAQLQQQRFDEGFRNVDVSGVGTSPTGGSATANPFGVGDNLDPFAGLNLAPEPIFPNRNDDRRQRFPAAFDPRIADIPEPLGLPSLPPPDFNFNTGDEDLGSPIGTHRLGEPIRQVPTFNNTRFAEEDDGGHASLAQLQQSRALDASNFAIAGQAGDGPGPGGGVNRGNEFRGGDVLSGDQLPSLIPEGTPTFEHPFDGVDIPLPVGLAPLFDGEGGGAIGRPKSIFAQVGLPELSAQSQRNLIPGELAAFKQLAAMSGIPESMINNRLSAQRTGGGQRRSRISSAGGSF